MKPFSLVTTSLFLGLLTVNSLSLSLSIQTIAHSQEIRMDRNCRPNQKLSQMDSFRVFYQSEFRANDQKYWLYSGRYQDGAAIVCLSKPNFNQATVLDTYSELRSSFIRRIAKHSRSGASYILSISNGNGRRTSITDYKLDLTNPKKPVLTKLRTYSEQ